MSTIHQDDFVLLSKEDAQAPDEASLRSPSPNTVVKIHEWLDPTAYNDGTSEYLRHLTSHVRGTGSWLPETDAYKKWHSSEGHNVLWIKAVAGAGKSVLAAHQRARISSTEIAPVLHFFFRQIITSNRTPKQLVRDWLDQLLPYSLDLQKRFKIDILEQSVSLETASFQTLWTMLRDAVSQLPRVYCFADALDEMSTGHEDFILSLIELGKLGSCRVFLTSRPVPRIVEILRKQPLLDITLGPENMDADISIYVDHRLDRDIDRYIQHRLRTSNIDLGSETARAAIEPLVRSKLQSKAQGSFLYARLMMDNVLQAISKASGDINPFWMQKILDELPTGLTEMYGNMLRDHAARSGTPQKLQQIILQWVTHSERPLRMLELAAIVDRESGTLERNKDTKAVVRAGCGPLIEILPSDVVGPVHHSFTEYLTRDPTKSVRPGENERQFPPFESKPTHRAIALQCINYMLHVLQDAGNLSVDDMKRSYPFLDYSMRCWPAHLSKCGDLDSELINLLDVFMMSPEKFEVVLLATGARENRYGRQNVGPKLPMHLAASIGVGAYVTHLKELGYDINEIDKDHLAPIHYAAKNGNAACLEVLISAGAILDHRENGFMTPLHLAAMGGHSEAAAVLLKNGVDPLVSTPTTEDRLSAIRGQRKMIEGVTAVQSAAQSGDVRTMIVFLHYLSPESMSAAFFHVIQRSTFNKDSTFEVTAAILSETRFEINRKHRGMTTLFMAAYGGDAKLIRKVLDAGGSAEILSQCNFDNIKFNPSVSSARDSVLHAYARSFEKRHISNTRTEEECHQVVKMLVEAGCSLEARDSRGLTALQIAQSSYGIASGLLRNGADATSVIESRSCPLHDIAGCDVDVMRLWMSYGLDINGYNNEGFTPLHLAVQQKNYFNPFSRLGGMNPIPYQPHDPETMLKRIRALLNLGADARIATRGGSSSLHEIHRFSRFNSEDIVRLLVDYGADVNTRDKDGKTPLMMFVEEFVLKSAQILVEAGADIHARDHKGETWLMKMVMNRSFGMVSKFDSTMGFDFLAANWTGANLIHIHVNRNFEIEPLEKLDSLGVDVHAVDVKGNTALHYHVANKWSGEPDAGMLKKLLDLGVDPSTRNNLGQSIFFMAAAGGPGGFGILELVCKHKFDVNEADNRGIAPIHVAATNSPEVTKKLLERGADVSKRTVCGRTALHSASLANQPEVISVLLSHVPSEKVKFVNIRDGVGRTALIYAARSGCPESVRLLLEAGADPNICDLESRSALEACALFLKERERIDSHRMRPNSTRHLNVMEFLTEDWEEMSRFLAFCRGADYTKMNVRQCVRYLTSAGAELYKDFIPANEPPRWISGMEGPEKTIRVPEHQRVEHVLDRALEHHCKPVIWEVMEAMKAFDEKRADRRTALRSINLQLDLGMYKSRREQITSMYESTEDDEGRKEWMKRLMLDDSPEDILKMGRAGFDFFASHDYDHTGRWPRTQGNALEAMIDKGLHETLRLLRPLFDSIGHSEMAASAEQWIDESSIRGRNLQFKNLKSCKEVLPKPLDGLLLRACEAHPMNTQVIRTIVSDYGCSQHEMTNALFKMAGTAEWWHLEAVEVLLDQNLDVNFRNPVGRTPLLIACHNGRYKAEMVRVLLKRGADPDIMDNSGNTCLSGAVGNSDAVAALLTHGTDIQIGPHALAIRSIKERDAETLKLLIKSGVNLNQLGPESDKRDDVSVVLEGHAISNSASYPLHYALCHSVGKDCDAIMSGIGMRDMNNQVTKEDKVIVELLLKGGADPFLMTRNKSPILHEVLGNPYGLAPHVLEILPGLDLEKRDSRGCTLLLSLASVVSYHLLYQYIERMIELGSDVSATDHKGRNFLHLVFAHKAPARVRPDSFTSPSKTLHDVYKELLEKESVRKLVNLKDEAGFTPVHKALATQPWEVIKLLSEHGADLATPDPNGDSALHLFLAKIDTPVEEVADSDSRPRLEEMGSEQRAEYIESHSKQEAESLLRAVELFTSAGNDVNALSGGPAGEPALFGYLRARTIASTPGYLNGSKEIESMQLVRDLKMLVERAGVDLCIKARNGQTALHALAIRHIEFPMHHIGQEYKQKFNRELRAVWNLLVDAGLDPYMEDNEQRSALDIAAVSGNTAVMEMY